MKTEMLTLRYAIASRNGQKGITCHTCGITSFHPEDVSQRYCAHCKVYHDDAGQEAALEALMSAPEGGHLWRGEWRGIVMGCAYAVGFVLIAAIAYWIVVGVQG